MVVEVRHSSWNNEGTLRYFTKKGVSFCNIDQPQIGRALEPTEHVTAPIAVRSLARTQLRKLVR